MDAALDEFGGLDAVVNNAGIFHIQRFEDLTAETWSRMLRVHLDGAFHVSQPAYRELKRRGYGRFVFAASSAGLFGQPSSYTIPTSIFDEIARVSGQLGIG